MKLAHILKFNPFHDEAGRFSDHEGSVFVSTGAHFATTIDRLKGQLKESEKNANKPFTPLVQDYFGLQDKSINLIESTQKDYQKLDVYEQDLLYKYTGAHSKTFNKLSGLMGEGKPIDNYYTQVERDKVDQLDTAIRKMSVPEDMVVYRAVTMNRLGKAFGLMGRETTVDEMEDLVGRTYKEHSFASSSTSLKTANSFMGDRRTLVEISAPKGAKGAWVGGSSHRGSHASENELVIPKGVSYIITGAIQRTDEQGENYHVLQVRMLG